MKVGDVVKYKKISKPTPEDWRSVLYDRIGIVIEVSANSTRVVVSYPGLQYSPYGIMARDLELISAA